MPGGAKVFSEGMRPFLRVGRVNGTICPRNISVSEIDALFLQIGSEISLAQLDGYVLFC